MSTPAAPRPSLPSRQHRQPVFHVQVPRYRGQRARWPEGLPFATDPLFQPQGVRHG